ncbi:MAG: hypothetical protein J6S14_21320 [Clostridia bacterium]|nr:hypothetical protein [Clostridia bacterium]
MRTRTQKIISLVLVLMMLVSMVPMGIFTANAAVSAELKAGLANIANTPEFVINSVEDWNYFAETTATMAEKFANKTIRLNTNIESATLKTLFGNSANTCGIGATVDFSGYTLKNITVDGPALLFHRADAVTVKNIDIDGLIVANSDFAKVGGLGAWTGPWGTQTFENITMKNVDIKYTGTTSASAVVGGLLGSHTNNATTTSNFKNINIDGKVSSNSPNGGQYSGLGGLIGYITSRGTCNYENIYCAVDVTDIRSSTSAVPDSDGTAGVGGFIGKSTQDGMETNYTCKQIFTNCIYAGTLTSCVVTGGFIGYDRSTNENSTKTTNFYNCIAATKWNHTYAGGHDYTGVFLVSRGGIATNWRDCYTTTAPVAGTKNAATPYNYFFGISGLTLNNSSSIAGNGGDQNTQITDIGTVSTEIIEYMLTKDENGFITSVHEPEGLGYDLLNYDATKIFTVTSVDDWKLLAASGKNFSGKTVQLGNNIDAAGATLPPLAPLAVNNSSVTLDGAGYTIKNVGTAENPQTRPLVSEKYSSGTVKDITFENIVMKSTTDNIGIVTNCLNSWGVDTFTNIKVTNCNITSTSGAAGALIGYQARNSSEGSSVTLNVSNVVVDADTTVSGAKRAGGILGSSTGALGSFNFDKIYVAATVQTTEWSPIEGETYNNAGFVGGIVGYIETSNSVKSASFENCVIKANLHVEGGGGWGGRCYGLAGRVSGVSELTVSNVIIELKGFTNMVMCGTLLAGSGATKAVFENIYTVGSPSSDYWNESTGGTINGTSVTNANQTLGDIIATTSAKASKLYRTDANGFVTYVYDHIDADGIQFSAVSGGKYAVRFIAMSQLAQADNVNMVIIATCKDADGNVVKKLKFDSEKTDNGKCNLYDALTAYDAYGIGLRKTAVEYGAEKLAGFTIYDIPVSSDDLAYATVTFEVTTSYKDSYDHTVYGANVMTVTFDANGALVK